MSFLVKYLDHEGDIELTDNELIGNFYQIMRQKTLGCDKVCPLCRRQCDQDHNEAIKERYHRCNEGHRI